MAIELVDRRELLYSSVAGDVLPTSNVIENTIARDTDGAVVDKIWDGAAWVISGLYIWKPGNALRSADLSEDGFENINHVTTGITVGYLNELGVSGSPYVAYASMIIGQSNKNLSAGYSLIIGTFHDINNNGGAYNLVTGFFNKITATGVGADTGDVMVVAGKYNNMSGSGNVSLGGVDLQAGAPTRFFEVKGFGNFNFSWVGEEDLLGSLDGFGNLMHGYNNAIGPDAQFCAIIGGKAIDMSTLNADNVVVIGMNTFTPIAGLNEATYVNLLSINKLRETPLVTNIGLDADGFVVGSAALSGSAVGISGAAYTTKVIGSTIIAELSVASGVYTLLEISTYTRTDFFIKLKNISGGTVTVNTSGSDTIEGNTSITLIDGESVEMYISTATEFKL